MMPQDPNHDEMILEEDAFLSEPEEAEAPQAPETPETEAPVSDLPEGSAEELETFLGGNPAPDVALVSPGEPAQEVESQQVVRRAQPMRGQSVNVGGGLETDVDMVFVIDLTGSMQPLLDMVKQKALSFHHEVQEVLAKKHRKIRKLRIKVIGYRDYYFDWQDPDHPPIQESQFFMIPEEEAEFASFLNSLEYAGGEDEPESALEALHLAFRSEWNPVVPGIKSRQMVLVFTDASGHALDDPMRADPEFNSHYPENSMPHSLEEMQSEFMDPTVFPADANGNVRGHRLILFAPENMYPWKDIKDWVATSCQSMDPEKGLQELDMEQVYNLISGSFD